MLRVRKGVNAIYEALHDIRWFWTFEFPKASTALGKSKNVGLLLSRRDKRTTRFLRNGKFTVEYSCDRLVFIWRKFFAIVKLNVKCEVTSRSLRLRPSGIDANHPTDLISGKKWERNYMVHQQHQISALIQCRLSKHWDLGIARSHSADEFIFTLRIKDGISTYISWWRN